MTAKPHPALKHRKEWYYNHNNERFAEPMSADQKERLPEYLTDDEGQQVYDAKNVAALLAAIMGELRHDIERGKPHALLFLHTHQFAAYCNLAGAEPKAMVRHYMGLWGGGGFVLEVAAAMVALYNTEWDRLAALWEGYENDRGRDFADEEADGSIRFRVGLAPVVRLAPLYADPFAGRAAGDD